MTDHNHVTADVKSYGECPACDEVIGAAIKNVQQLATSEIYGEDPNSLKGYLLDHTDFYGEEIQLAWGDADQVIEAILEAIEDYVALNPGMALPWEMPLVVGDCVEKQTYTHNAKLPHVEIVENEP